MSANYFLVLASGSPRRREFMKLLGLPFSVILPTVNGEAIDETPLPDESPTHLVERLSRLKAKAVVDGLRSLEDHPFLGNEDHSPAIIAADTTVACAGQILNKPADAAEARQMLTLLREQPHAVYSGLTVATPMWANGYEEDQFITRVHINTVQMRPYTDAEIEAYIATGDPMDKAGAYAIQHREFAPVERLEGCFASVMGLPLADLAEILRELGLTLPPIAPLCTHLTQHACCQE